MFTYYILVILFGVLFVIKYYFVNKIYGYWNRKGVPYPKPIFPFGNLGKVITLNSNISDICNDIYKNHKNYKYVGFFNLWTPALVIRDPELIKRILIKEFHSFQNNWVETEIEVDFALYYNPFGLKYDEWKSIRPKLTPQFTSAKIKSTFTQTRNVCERMINYIKIKIEEHGSNTLEITQLTLRFTGDNVLSCAYGLDGKSFDTEFPDCFKIGDQISSTTKVTQIKKMIGLFLPSLRKFLGITFVGNPTPKLFSDMILDAIDYRDQNNVTRNDYLDFLRELRDNSSEVTKEELVGHAFTFFLDGVDTASLALSYALFELCLNPNIQATARNEIEMILKKHAGQFTSEALQEMNYIENIVIETLRKHPIIKILNRVCTNDCTFPLPNNLDTTKRKVLIEKGTQIFIPLQSIQNDTDNYLKPNKFDPDRFKEVNSKGCFFGFGDGPRICLGRRFAIQQIKAALVAILSEFEIRLNDKTKLPLRKNNNLHLSDAPADGIWIDFCYTHSNS